nr:hypothetical protein [Leucobacter viscericola]
MINIKMSAYDFSSAMQAGPHGAYRYLERFGDTRRIELRPSREREHVTVPFRKLSDDARNRTHRKTRVDTILGIKKWVMYGVHRSFSAKTLRGGG